MCLLSGDYIESKACQDELALAQVYNKPIFPCALDADTDQLFPKMQAGMSVLLSYPCVPLTSHCISAIIAYNDYLARFHKDAHCVCFYCWRIF